MQTVDIEAEMVAGDACALRDFALAIQDGVVGLGVTPFACFFIVEAYDWLRHYSLAGSENFLELEASRIRTLRARLKLFDDRGGFKEVLQHLQTVDQASVRMFQGKHTGNLACLKKLLQDDLGFFFMGDDLVCTTHVGLINAGYLDTVINDFDESYLFDSIGSELHGFAENIGRFISKILQILNCSAETSFIRKPRISISAEDHKANIVYPLINNRLGISHLQMGAAFTWLISQVNYVNLVLRDFFHSDNDLFFRFRFLTVYYSLRALQTIGNFLKGDRTSEIGQLISELLTRPNARRIRRLDKLRNAIAHYRSDQPAHLFQTENHLDVIIQHLAGLGRVELSHLLDEELDAISKRCRTVVSRGEFGGNPVIFD
jgi:hypothetical protein